jgi:hypothetical protein
MPRAPATAKAVDHEEGVMALLEKEAIRFAESLDDYEHVSATDIGGWGPGGSAPVTSSTSSEQVTAPKPSPTRRNSA